MVQALCEVRLAELFPLVYFVFFVLLQLVQMVFHSFYPVANEFDWHAGKRPANLAMRKIMLSQHLFVKALDESVVLLIEHLG